MSFRGPRAGRLRWLTQTTSTRKLTMQWHMIRHKVRSRASTGPGRRSKRPAEAETSDDQQDASTRVQYETLDLPPRIGRWCALDLKILVRTATTVVNDRNALLANLPGYFPLICVRSAAHLTPHNGTRRAKRGGPPEKPESRQEQMLKSAPALQNRDQSPGRNSGAILGCPVIGPKIPPVPRS